MTLPCHSLLLLKQSICILYKLMYTMGVKVSETLAQHTFETKQRGACRVRSFFPVPATDN